MKKFLFMLFFLSIAMSGCSDNKNDSDKNNSNTTISDGKADSDIEFERQRELRNKMFRAIDSSDFKSIDSLLKEGVSIDLRESIGGFSFLTHAIFYKFSESAKYLIEKGANVNNSTLLGISPLMMAIQVKDLELAKLLIDKGADVNAIDVDGRPPLYYAIYRNNAEEIAKYLIQNKAEVNVVFTLKKNIDDPDEKGVKKTLLQFAKEKGKQEIIAILIAAGAK